MILAIPWDAPAALLLSLRACGIPYIITLEG